MIFGRRGEHHLRGTCFEVRLHLLSREEHAGGLAHDSAPCSANEIFVGLSYLRSSAKITPPRKFPLQETAKVVGMLIQWVMCSRTAAARRLRCLEEDATCE